MKKRIIIRADGGTSIGMGHIIRCLALADMLKKQFSISFAIQKPVQSVINIIHGITEKIIELPKTGNYNEDAIHFCQHLKSDDIVVLDGYNFKTDYQKAIKEKGCKLVAIDDLHDWHQLADVVINHAEGVNESDYSTESYTKLCLGLDYVLLRKEFLNADKVPRTITSVKKIFTSMGAADINNLTQKFVDALVQIKGIEEIHLMLGDINPNLKSIDKFISEHKEIKIITHFNISAKELADLLKTCDICICPASSISLESCAIGIGLVSGFTADNQHGILNGLLKHAAADNLDDLNRVSINEIKERFQSLMEAPSLLNDQVKHQKRMIDGRSSERLNKEFRDLSESTSKEKLHFRFATKKDVELYFEWANDDVVRSNSFNQNKVIYEDHVKWFNSKLESKSYHFYLFLNENNIPVGQVRIVNNEKETIIGISIDKNFRGKSLGVEMLKQSCFDFLSKNKNETITAYIKLENKASYSIFKKAGFANEEIVTEQNFKSYKLHKKLSH